MINLHFSQNWNNKLDCDVFTSIRIYDPSKHLIGEEYTITWTHGKEILSLENRVCIHMHTFVLASLTNGLALVDTGYDAKATVEIIRKMYKNKNFDVDKIILCALYLKRKK